MRLNRTKNAIKNSVWGIISRVVTLLMPFVVRTVMIKTIGVDYLGLSSLFISIITVLNLTELGIGDAIVYSMYKPIAENDRKTICALMSLYKKLYRIIGLTVLVIGACLIPFLPYLIHGETPPDVNLYILYAINLAGTVSTYWLFAYQISLLNAHQRNDVISKVSTFVYAIMYIIQILVLVTSRNYYAYFIIHPIFTIIVNLINAGMSRKLYPEYHCEGTILKEDIEDIKRRIMGLVVSKVAFASRHSFDSIIVSAFLGLEVLAIYNNYYYLIAAISGIMVVLMSSISAGIGNSLVLETKDKNENDLRSLNFLYMSVSFICFCCFIALYQPFMKLWVGDDLMFSDAIMLSFCSYFIVEKTLNLIGQYYDASGLWWHGKLKSVIEALGNLILNILLCKVFGTFGIVLASIITMVFIGLPMTTYYVFKYSFDKSPCKYLLEQFVDLLIYGSIGCVVYIVTSLFPLGDCVINSVIYMLLRLIVTLGISFLLYFIIYRKNRRFLYAKEWATQHLRLLFRK